MGDRVADILKRATETGLRLRLEGDKIKADSMKGGVDPSVRKEIFREISQNKGEIIIRLKARKGKPKVVDILEELGAVPSTSVDAPSQECGRCSGTNWRLHSQEVGTWLCVPCYEQTSEALRDRMRNGTTKLIKMQSLMNNEEVTDRYLRMTEKFSEWLALWSDLEHDLRSALDYHGCIYARGGCPKDSPVRCGACG